MPKSLRCAIYTRVSTENGLEQEFNSLHAQREASEAYVKSQAHEGWKPLREKFDDGGFSGGSMERPALQKLLADIKERKIDIVVIYKVDRLTRSLADFAKLVELFDAHGVSFVSVTQSFNTTSSMGRLTLNVLLSFAQFEREVTGERIRDKIAASKKKGLWVGGVVPLGYAVKDKKLIVNEEEANTVRLIFERYLALPSLSALQEELRTLGTVTRTRRLTTGKTIGGVPLTNGPLNHLLRNRMYLGEINHRGKSYPGEHASIVDAGLFDRVQVKLTEHRQSFSLKHQRSEALLLGKLFDDRSNRMTPSFAIKKGVRYRYYVSAVLAQGRKGEAGSISRIASDAIESVVLESLARLPLPQIVDVPGAARDNAGAQSARARIEGTIERVIISDKSIEIRRIKNDIVGSDQPNPLVIPWSPKTFFRKREIIQPVDVAGDAQPLRAETRDKLLAAIAKARCWLAGITKGAIADIETIAERENITLRSVRMILSLAFLAPNIVRAAASGILPRGFGVSRLTDLPADWAEQHRKLGLPVAC
jgi:DNA invertase Pin-like site-specific DNA recombinase